MHASFTKYGFVANGLLQNCVGMTVYPRDYFCPMDFATGIISITENTYSIHWYDMSWWPWYKKIRNKISRIIHRVFGKDIREKMERRFEK